MRTNSLRFNIQELGGALGDMGTLLPLMVALILINGLNPTVTLAMVGLFYIVSGLYFRIPTPVQPLKAVAAIAITLGLSATVIGAAGLIMGAILLFLSLTNLINVVVKLFPKAVVRGIQLAIGLTLLRKGIELAFSEQIFISGSPRPFDLGQVPVGLLLAGSAVLVFVLFKFVFFKNSQRFPPSLALLTFGFGSGVVFGHVPGVEKIGPVLSGIALPSSADYLTALIVLVIPQLPLTLGNAVVGMSDTARTYFKDQAKHVTPRALSTSMGLANIATGLIGAMPMCHGSGGLTAHYKLGARTGGANLMVGGLILIIGLVLGNTAVPFLSLIPLSVLGVLLAIVGIYHAFLIRDLSAWRQLAVAGAVAIGTFALGSLAYGFAAGILLHHILELSSSGAWRRFPEAVKRYRKEQQSYTATGIKQDLVD